MIKIRCKNCNEEFFLSSKRTCCGCPNKTTVDGDKITAIDLKQVEIIKVNNELVDEKKKYLTSQDLEFQENRKKRKVKKLDFEVR
jgi:hypothetical protein